MHVEKNIDVLMLLAGENPKKRSRSLYTIDLFETGKFGYIFITGGPGAMNTNWKEDFSFLGYESESESEKIANFICMRGIPQYRMYVDGRSVDTLGNFAVPYTHPIDNNPDLVEFESIAVVTEKNHMERAMKYAKLVIPKEKLSSFSSDGDYKPGPILSAYNFAMFRRLRHFKTPDAGLALEFLLREHPFYQKGWFSEKSMRERQIELGKTVLKWMV